MLRLLPIAGFAIASLGITGCAGGGWETVSSHRWREEFLKNPYTATKRLYVPEDPMIVLRTEPPRDGDELAFAMRRLKEPIRNKGTQEDQDAIIGILGKFATSDPSPVIRLEAIGALGRFEDPRVAGILMAAYQQAQGLGDAAPPPRRPSDRGVIPAGGAVGNGGRAPVGRSTADLFSLDGPTGYPPEWVCAIRCRSAESLGHTNRPDAAKFLSMIAMGPRSDGSNKGVKTADGRIQRAGGAPDSDVFIEGSDDRDVRLAAVRGLGKCRLPEAVVALAQVLDRETRVEPTARDVAMIGRTHEGLVHLTGKKLPPNPDTWNEVVQADIAIAPEPGWWENTIVQVSAWVKSHQ